MQNFFDSKTNRFLASLALFMLILALGAYAKLTFDQAKYGSGQYQASISVTGEGEVLAVPDIGQFTFSVEAEADTAAVAQEESGTKMNTILQYLRDQGIADKDIKTQNYNLYPKYRWEERVCQIGTYCGPGEQIQDGFTVSQSVTVKVRTIADAGKIIAGVGELGATNISGLSFTIDDTDALKAQARAEAIAEAQQKAALLAQQLGVRVVRLVGYYEDEGGYYEPYYQERAFALDSGGGSFNGPEFPTGEQSTKVRLTITYEVK